MIQVIKCKCGKIFSACSEPECYTDEDYQKNLREDIKRGCTVEMVENGTWFFEKCTCENTTTEIDKNQLSLF